MSTILLLGNGRLGSSVLDQLVPRFPDWNYVIVSRSQDSANMRLNLSRYVFSQWGLHPSIKHITANLSDVERMSEVISMTNPDIVFNATTPFPWWRISELPGDLSQMADAAGPGMWAALDVLLPFLVTKAVGQSGVSPVHVNACYPDLTNAFLKGAPGAPLVGIGNISNLIPGFRLAYAAEWGIDPSSIEVRFVGHHYTSLNAPSTSEATPAPFLLEIKSDERELQVAGPSAEPFQVLRKWALRTRGEAGQAVTTGSASTVLAAFMSGKDGQYHCPGALGLPGGYPVRISAGKEVSLDLPKNLEANTAQIINEKAQFFDGTQAVDSSGVIPSLTSLEAQEMIMGFNTPKVTIENCIEYANEMLTVLNGRYKLGLGTL